VAWDLPTDLVNETGLIEGMSNWAYDVTGGLFFVFLLLGFCISLFFATSHYTTDRSFSFASIAGLFGAIILTSLNLIAWYYASIFIITGIIGIVTMVMRER